MIWAKAKMPISTGRNWKPFRRKSRAEREARHRHDGIGADHGDDEADGAR